jgi:hypothetical protein
VLRRFLADYRHRLVFGEMNSPIQYKRAVTRINPSAMENQRLIDGRIHVDE